MRDGKCDLKIRSYNFSRQVLSFVNSLAVNSIHFSILNQLIKRATSFGANIVEGRAASSRKDLIRFYGIALKFATKTKYWLCLIRDTMPVDKTVVTKLLEEAVELSKIIAESLITLKQKQMVFKEPNQDVAT